MHLGESVLKLNQTNSSTLAETGDISDNGVSPFVLGNQISTDNDANKPELNNETLSRSNGLEAKVSEAIKVSSAILSTGAQAIPELGEAIPSNWVTIDGEFILVYSAQQTHLSSDCLFAPKAKLDDGVIWLLFIKGSASRAQILQFLIALDTGTHVNLPFLTMVPVRAFRLEPTDNQGRLTVDGELIECSPLQAEMVPGIARVMTR